MPSPSMPAIGYTATLANLDVFLAGLGAMAAGAERVSGGIDWIEVKSVAAGMALYNLAAQGAQKLLSLAEAGIDSAARFGEMNRVLYTLGAQFGQTQPMVDANVKSIKALGIETGVAQQSLLSFMRYQIPATDTTKLARVAQDAAVISMSNSSDAMNRMIYGIVSGQTEVLRTMQLNVNFEQSYQKLATQLGKNVQALNETERVQARVNAVMEAGASIAGTYEAAMQDPGKRLRSLERVWNEISLTIGQQAMPAFAAYVGIMENLAKSIQAAVSEGGKLYPILQTLGALAAIAGEQLGGFAKTLTTQGIDALAAFGNEVGRVAEDALTWGFNIVAQFASGIAEGAATVLVTAMNFISSILEQLAPGSPPKIAPDLDKWGTAAMTVWLEGFTEADYSILDSIGSSLQNVFGALAGAGIMDKAGIPALMLELTRGFTEAIETGSDTTALLARIGALTGAYSSEVTQLVTQQLALAQATAAVTAAQKAYTDAQKAEAAAQTKIGTLTAEYNKLLRGGASKDALKAKLAEVRAAEAAAKAARGERVAAGEAVTVAGEKADALQKEVSLQAKLVQQLNALFKLQAEANAPAARTPSEAEAAKKAGVVPPVIPPIKPFVQPDIKPDTSIFDKLKADLQTKLTGIFAPLVAEWNKTILPKLAEVWDAFDRLRIVVSDLFTLITTWLGGGDAQAGIRILGEITGGLLGVRLAWLLLIGPILTLLSPLGKVLSFVLTIIGELGGVTGILSAIATALGISVGTLLAVVAVVVGAIVLLRLAWVNNWGDIQGKTKIVIDWLKQAFADIKAWFVTEIPKAIADLGIRWATFTVGLTQRWRDFQDGLQTKWIQFTNFFTIDIPRAIAGFKAKWAVFTADLTQWWGAFWGGLEAKLIQLRNWFTTGIAPAIARVKVVWADFTGILTAFWHTLQTVGQVIGAVGEVIGAAFNFVLRLVGGYLQYTLLPALQAIWTQIVTFFTPAWDTVSKAFTDLWNFLSTTFTGAWTSLQGVLADVANLLSTTFVGAWNTISTAFTTLWTFLSTQFNIAWGGLKTLLVDIWTHITTLATAAWATFSAALTTLWTFLSTQFKVVWNDIKTVLTDIWTHITVFATKAWTDFQAKLTSVWDWLVKNFKPLWESLLKTFQDIGTAISSGIQTALETLHKFLAESFIAKIIEYVASNGPLLALQGAFNVIANAADRLYGFLIKVRDMLNAIEPPWWAVPHSPPPLAKGFGFISDAVKELASIALPQLRTSLRVDTADLSRVQAVALQVSAPRVAGQVVNQRPTNITFQTTINNVMDAALFENRVRRVLARELAA